MNSDDQAELDERIRTIESPGYHDPAHADLPGLDVAVVAAVVVVGGALLLWWGIA
ncbi:hypothetical protein ACFXKD_18395 [Nocardiopsis aegyptia]|uniref:hypothetical protein n=1 Tax=Nocardiopsis aegyptia TaxID=220378 RepID=UPI00366C2A0D